MHWPRRSFRRKAEEHSPAFLTCCLLKAYSSSPTKLRAADFLHSHHACASCHCFPTACDQFPLRQHAMPHANILSFVAQWQAYVQLEYEPERRLATRQTSKQINCMHDTIFPGPFHARRMRASDGTIARDMVDLQLLPPHHRHANGITTGPSGRLGEVSANAQEPRPRPLAIVSFG